MPRERIFSPSGQKLEDRHGYIVDSDGVRIFTVTEQVNVSDRINGSLPGSTLYDMINRYLKTGDDSFLMQKAQSFNADLTVMPKNLIELYNIKSTCADDFQKFPVEYRNLFDNDVNKYFKAIQDNTITEITNKYFESKGKDVPEEKELKKDEQIVE